MPRTRIMVSAVAAAMLLAVPATAFSAEPNNQACLGYDFSGYALAGGSDFGQFNAALAEAVPGLGFPIQLHLAGLVPDYVVENSCND